MKIEQRDETLTYKRAIKADKVRLVLDWLLEFRFSSLDFLAKLLGSRADFMFDFFNRILNREVWCRNLPMPMPAMVVT